MSLVIRALRWLFTIVVALAVVWYVWALFPSIGKPPGVGELFTKPTPTVSKLASELKPPIRTTAVPVAEVKKACETQFFLRPLQGPPDHAVFQVTSGFTTIERNVSCQTHAYISPWRVAR